MVFVLYIQASFVCSLESILAMILRDGNPTWPVFLLSWDLVRLSFLRWDVVGRLSFSLDWRTLLLDLSWFWFQPASVQSFVPRP
jgi:hypothetical protein